MNHPLPTVISHFSSSDSPSTSANKPISLTSELVDTPSQTMTETDVKSKKARSPPSHPPFVEMIKEAIVALKERTGSSQYAITKFVEEKNKNLPQTFRKLLLYNLKKLVASGKLVKVKNSFKLPPVRSAPVKEKPDGPKPKKSAYVVVKPKPKAVAKPKSKVAAKSKPKAAAKPKLKAVAAKPTAAVKSKVKPAVAKPAAKVARTSTRTSPGKKLAVKSKAKKPVAPARAVKKPKSVKSPVKKATTAKGKK